MPSYVLCEFDTPDLPIFGYHDDFGTSITGVGPVVVGAGALNPASVKVSSQKLFTCSKEVRKSRVSLTKLEHLFGAVT